jgi:hypothetical protein
MIEVRSARPRQGEVMSHPTETHYGPEDYIHASNVAAALAKTGYDLSESERTALFRAASVLQSWALSMPRK